MKEYSKIRTDWTELASDLFPDPVTDPASASSSSASDKTQIDKAMARARIVRVSPPIKEP